MQVESFPQVVAKVVSMPNDRLLCDRVSKLGLKVINVMWEDTTRTPGSC